MSAERPRPAEPTGDELAHLLGEDRDDGHGVDPDGDGVPQQPQCLPRVPGQRGVGDPEARRLDLAAVVGEDDLLVDDAGRVVDELLAGGGELAHVLADGLDEGVHRLTGGLAAGPAELVGGEVGLVAVALEGRGLEDPGPRPAQRVEHLLAALAALVEHDEGEVGLGGVGDRGEQVGLEVLAGLVEVVDDEALGAAEERRARVQEQLTGLVGGGVHPDHLEVGLADPQLVEGLGQGPLGEQPLGPGDEDVRRHPVGDGHGVLGHGAHSATRHPRRGPGHGADAAVAYDLPVLLDPPADLRRHRRIVILGVTGSGKSSLAVRLAAVGGLAHVAVDDLMWRPGWVQLEAAEQVEAVRGPSRDPGG